MTMSPPALTIPQIPVSSGYRPASPTLSHKTISSRSSLAIVPSTAVSRSPVIKAVASSAALIPPVSLAVQQQQHHARSQSLPTLQEQFPKCLEFPVNAVWDNMHSSVANILTSRRDNLLGPQAYISYIPKSPRLMPLMSPGAVTPMQLEEDVEYRFPNLLTPLRHSPLVATLTIDGNMEDGESETEQVTEISWRSR
jgi:hypothetical protein